jgi:hypothetical protein
MAYSLVISYCHIGIIIVCGWTYDLVVRLAVPGPKSSKEQVNCLENHDIWQGNTVINEQQNSPPSPL